MSCRFFYGRTIGSQLHSPKPELRFCAGSSAVRRLSDIRDDEDLWQWSRLEIRLSNFRRSTILQNKQKKTTWSILNRLKKPSYTVVAEHDVKFKKLRYERAAARTDVKRKCKLLASFYHSTDIVLHFFYPFEAWALCNSLRIMLISFNSHSKNCEVKKQ